MPTTRKKIIKTIYKDGSEDETGDFSDSGSEAHISEPPTSDEDEIEENLSSADEFNTKTNKTGQKLPAKRKPRFDKEFLKNISKQADLEAEGKDVNLVEFSVKDLTEADKLLPSVLDLSESDSSDDESPKASTSKAAAISHSIPESKDNEYEDNHEYVDIWANNIPDNSEEVAKKAFLELEKHNTAIEETKASIQSYVPRCSVEHTKESNVTDLLALGEEVPAPPENPVKTKRKVKKKTKNESDSEIEDWEEVKESKAIPQQGLQLFVELPDAVCRKSKKVDVEMMMKRKMNKVKKEHQVFMHKVHVLCWIGHGNYVSPVLNDQEIMATVLAMVPRGCYPDKRLDMKYVEQITKWYKDKIDIKPDKYENKFRPKAPPLRNILLEQIKKRSVTSKKYMVFIFVAMLRALGLQCRVMFNFVTLPIRPPGSELYSLSTKPKDEKKDAGDKKEEKPKSAKRKSTENKAKPKAKLPQVDGNYEFSSSNSDIDDYSFSDYSDNEIESYNHAFNVKENRTSYNRVESLSGVDDEREFQNIMQVDGNDDAPVRKTRSTRALKANKDEEPKTDPIKLEKGEEEEGVSPPKIPKKNSKASPKSKNISIKKPSPQTITTKEVGDNMLKSPKSLSLKRSTVTGDDDQLKKVEKDKLSDIKTSPRKTRSNKKGITLAQDIKTIPESQAKAKTNKTPTSKNISPKNTQPNKESEIPTILVTNENNKEITQSKYFEPVSKRITRKRAHTTIVDSKNDNNELKTKDVRPKARTRSAPNKPVEKSKYFDDPESNVKKPKLSAQQLKKLEKLEDAQRVSHKDIVKPKVKSKNDVTGDLVNIVKSRIKHEKEEAKKSIVKGKIKQESDEDSDYLPVEEPKRRDSSDDDFKPKKATPKGTKVSPAANPPSKKKLDRRVLSSDEESPKNKVDVWCEVFVEELEQWVAVDVVNGKVHCTGHLYKTASHPVCYVIGWDNNNSLKDLTRRYVPHWNTVTRKQRVELDWWRAAVQPHLGPRNARDREEDEALDRMQLEAPLPTSIGEYKNHPLYALKRHLLKYEALYPPDARTLGFVRGEAVYARECVYICRSRDTWLKEAKVVKMGETPYKIVKARPKWDRLSNKLITDKPLEVFGPWQVKDYEPPTAENGVVPRNAYGNVELFKDCMLPKGTVHIKLAGLNKVCRKLNVDCAPAMTGFDYNGGWCHPVYDGFVVCREEQQRVTAAWLEDQEEQERKEREKIEGRVYGNWKRLIKGLLIKERLKYKYGFQDPSTSQPAKKKGPRYVAKKN